MLYTVDSSVLADSEIEWTNEGHEYRIPLYRLPYIDVNDYLAIDDDSVHLIVNDIDNKHIYLSQANRFNGKKRGVWGINPRNTGQTAALNHLMNPDIDLVMLQGSAGTGKTLLTMASALSQVLDQKLYSHIIITRATIAVGKDVGFLPGTESEKMLPWAGAMLDNLEVLCNTDNKYLKQSMDEIINSKMSFICMNFIRGRTFNKRFVIIDECQNLTNNQMKTIITRAGEGTKIVCLGDINQIDNPKLTKTDNGLSYLISRFQGCPLAAYVELEECTRSRLAAYAVEVL